MTTRKPLFVGSEWTFELLDDYHVVIQRIAKEYELNTYPNQIEICIEEIGPLSLGGNSGV